MEQFSRLFSIPLQILCWFLACESITNVLKSNAFKDRHISFILKDGHIPSFTSKRILYLQEYIQQVGDFLLPCNSFRMLVFCACVLYSTIMDRFDLSWPASNSCLARTEPCLLVATRKPLWYLVPAMLTCSDLQQPPPTRTCPFHIHIQKPHLAVFILPVCKLTLNSSTKPANFHPDQIRFVTRPWL